MSCQIQVSEIFKINPFKREACLRLSQNDTAVHEIHLQWNSLVLTCEPITNLFTRVTVHKIIDSKRCPHTGSCVGSKCGSINASSLIPELAIGNQYPGNTACVESCGGLGCDCFYPSSGCLFYRIYLVPLSDDIFELFHCNRWNEAAKIQVTHLDRLRKTSNTVTKFLLPNVPVKWDTFTITLSSNGIPPLPPLNTPFISNNKTTALWKRNMMPSLRCSNHTNARNLACEVFGRGSDHGSYNSEKEQEEPTPFPPKQTRLCSDLLQEPAKNEQEQLRRDLNNLLYGLNLLPKRKIGESSMGVAPHIRCTFCGQNGLHYSDTCPHITQMVFCARARVMPALPRAV
ncbi:hypothetical protein ANCCAN_20235 [Ancylostoma caninum]|uniref:Phlebovirus glycoprotein G2 fusion domain-containing protein n=1 Tax=Ancylostoma caninum TaxID=29170 RepID=A0A368FUK5_ANCCA|nr:hypothetical protein ANCCAN_20235 [Ancylostoma caninum]